MRAALLSSPLGKDLRAAALATVGASRLREKVLNSLRYIDLQQPRTGGIDLDAVCDELFSEVGWVQVMEGQNLTPLRHHPLAGLQSEQDTHDYLESVREVIAKCVAVMPDHAAYIAQNCAAKRM